MSLSVAEIVALVGSGIAVLTFLLNRSLQKVSARKSQADVSKIESEIRQSIIADFEKLCDDLRTENARLRERLDEVEKRQQVTETARIVAATKLGEVEHLFSLSRKKQIAQGEAWRKERARLAKRVHDMEMQNEKLTQELCKLQTLKGNGMVPR